MQFSWRGQSKLVINFQLFILSFEKDGKFVFTNHIHKITNLFLFNRTIALIAFNIMLYWSCKLINEMCASCKTGKKPSTFRN